MSLVGTKRSVNVATHQVAESDRSRNHAPGFICSEGSVNDAAQEIQMLNGDYAETFFLPLVSDKTLLSVQLHSRTGSLRGVGPIGNRWIADVKVTSVVTLLASTARSLCAWDSQSNALPRR